MLPCLTGAVEWAPQLEGYSLALLWGPIPVKRTNHNAWPHGATFGLCRGAEPLVGMSAQVLPLTERRVLTALLPSPLSCSPIDAHAKYLSGSPMNGLYWRHCGLRGSLGVALCWPGLGDGVNTKCSFSLLLRFALFFVSKGSFRASALGSGISTKASCVWTSAYGSFCEGD